MLSIAPTTTRSKSPPRIAVNPHWIAFMPEPQTMLTVAAPTESGTPAPRSTWRAGFCPAPAWSACPKSTSSTSEGTSPARSIAARAARVPSRVAGTIRSDPPNRPIGVRAAERIATAWGGAEVMGRRPGTGLRS